jgi:hypothetical protein
MAEMILVRSTLPQRDDDGWPVALYEQDDAHPDGEAYVAGPDPVEVARTGLVNRRISEGALEIGEGASQSPARPRLPQGRSSASAGNPPADPLAFLTDEQRAALTAAGYGTPEAIRAANDEQLDAVPGIGEAAVQKLRDATKE